MRSQLAAVVILVVLFAWIWWEMRH